MVSIRYSERLSEAGIEPSVGSVGDSFDNALAETINGLYKAEVIHRRGPWRSFRGRRARYSGMGRLVQQPAAPGGPPDNIPPAEAAERHYSMLEQSDMAVLTSNEMVSAEPGRGSLSLRAFA